MPSKLSIDQFLANGKADNTTAGITEPVHLTWRDGQANNPQAIAQTGLVLQGKKGSFLYRAPLLMPAGQSLALVAVDKNTGVKSVLPVGIQTDNALQVLYSYTVKNSNQCLSVPDIPGCKETFYDIYGKTTVYPSYGYPLDNLTLNCTLTAGAGRIEACDRVTKLKDNFNGVTVYTTAQPGHQENGGTVFAKVHLGLKGYPEIPGTDFCVARCPDLRIDRIEPSIIYRNTRITVTGEGLDRVTALYLGGLEYSRLAFTATSNQLVFQANLLPNKPWQGPITIHTVSGQRHSSQQIVNLVPAKP
ncbi:MAG TPA: hypothetical protein ENI62_11010 [Gammaproteobacteria bacterium]|nr:hypothetical protein [Gammaproteobacteria bacterium]